MLQDLSGLRPVAGLKLGDLRADLPRRTDRKVLRQQPDSILDRGSDPVLIDDTGIFFLDFQKNSVPITGDAIAADPELFLIDRLFQTGPDQLPIGGVIIKITESVTAVAVRREIGPHLLQQHLLLVGMQPVFFS